MLLLDASFGHEVHVEGSHTPTDLWQCDGQEHLKNQFW